MSRQRVINPEFWLDEEISQCDYVVRLFYIGTWNFSDDYGVIEDNLPKLKAQIFPYETSLDIEPHRNKLVEMGKLIPFEANSKKWLFIKNFLKWQKVEKPSKWQNPTPPLEIIGNTMIELYSGRSRGGVVSEVKRSEVKRSEEKKMANAIIAYFMNEYKSIKETDYIPCWGKDYMVIFTFLKGKNMPNYKDLIDWFLKSPKCKEHPSISACFSTATINLYKIKHKDE